MSAFLDSYKHKGMRKQLLKKIMEKGIKDKNVLRAIAKIPRHFFFEPIFDFHAYEDKAFPIGANQTISQPYTVAFQTELLQIQPQQKILEIGTGSGYQSCVLLEMGAEVYSIEYQRELYLKAIRFLPKIGYNPYMYFGDGSKGMSRFAPYDAILVTAGAPSIPQALIDQLKVGGRIVIPQGNQESQYMMLVQKLKNGEIREEKYHQFKFVPLLGENGWK